MSGKRIGNPKILTTALAKTNQQGVPKTINDRSIAIPIKDVIDERLVDLGVINASPCCSEIAAEAKDREGVAIATTALATIATVTEGIQAGLITSTSAAAVTLTLPTATQLATSIGATRGTTVDFIVDNSTGSNTITLAVNTGITVGTVSITGSGDLTVSTVEVMGWFRIYFTSTTTAIIRRIS